jgi:probable HAF family extracellular repeat protein
MHFIITKPNTQMKKTNKVSLVNVFLIIVAVLISNSFLFSQQPVTYTIVDLGTLGGLTSTPMDINDLEDVVGFSRIAGNSVDHAFLYHNGAMADLGTLGGSDSEAGGINDAGQIAGSSVNSLGDMHAFLYQAGVWTDLGTLGGISSFAHSINELGDIVGISGMPNNQDQHAFLFKDGVMNDLGSLNGTYGVARAINNADQVVGYVLNPTVNHAFLWENGVMTDIGPLGMSSDAVDINDSGYVLIKALPPNSSYTMLLYHNGIMTDFGPVGSPYGINNTNQVVGSYSASGGGHAFIWQNGIRSDLNDLISPNSGWVINAAYAINNQGVIVARGYQTANPQSVRAIMLVPNSLTITQPQTGELFIAGEQDTIKWNGGVAGQLLQIEFSVDSGSTFNVVDFGVSAETGKYVWGIPDTILSTKCRLRIFDMIEPTKADTSDVFKTKGYVLTRLTPDGNYEAFQPAIHGWNYQNGTLWPQTWWSQFNYSTAIDPYTNDPYPDFFHSVADSSFIDWPLWVEVFSEDSCYWSTTIFDIYKDEAEFKWKDHTRVPHNGSCFGLAASSFLIFNFKDQFVAKHPIIPPNFTNLFNLPLDSTIQKIINGYYAYQYGKQSLDNDVTGQLKDPRTTLQEIKNMFINEVTDISTITVYKPGGGGAHTMAPIKLLKDNSGPSRYGLYLYDSNNPGFNLANILIDSLNNTWTEFTGLGYGTGTNKFYLEIPVSNYLNTPILGKHFPNTSDNIKGTGNIEFYNTERANVIYTSSTGSKIGVINGFVTDEIESGIAIFNKTGNPSDPIGYYLPDDIYSATVSNIVDATGRVYMSAFKSNVIYDYSRENANATQMDKFRIDGGFSVISPDTDDKQINLVVIAKLDSSERILFINETQLRQNDSLYITELNQSEFVIKNYGAAKTYGLELNERSSQEQEIFQKDIVTLQANSSQTFLPNWNDLDRSELIVLVDVGIDGTIDDTLTLTNQYTSVDNQGSLLTPNSYNLAQNYPNPFNPTTTIQYSIPQRSNVVLKVYDILGNEVAILVNEEKNSGVYTVSFDGSDLASGIYLYRLQAGSFIETKKMLLLK